MKLKSIRCFFGIHDLYSYAEDANFKFDDLDLAGKSGEEITAKFFELTKLRCRRCKYVFDGIGGKT